MGSSEGRPDIPGHGHLGRAQRQLRAGQNPPPRWRAMSHAWCLQEMEHLTCFVPGWIALGAQQQADDVRWAFSCAMRLLKLTCATARLKAASNETCRRHCPPAVASHSEKLCTLAQHDAY